MADIQSLRDQILEIVLKRWSATVLTKLGKQVPQDTSEIVDSQFVN